MYNNPYFIPGFNPGYMIPPNLIRGAATNRLINGTRNLATNTLTTGAKTGGLFHKLNTGLSGIKSINWGGLINNTSKTLGIINQSIPLVKQVGPMVTNMKSMIKVASLFKDESYIPQTNQRNKPQYQTTPTTTKQTNPSTNTNNKSIQKEESTESPTFFINTV